MTAIVNFFKGLGDIIGTIIDFIVDFFTDLIYVIGLLGKFILEIPAYFGWLPAGVLAILLTTFSIVVIYMILGRK